MSPMTLFSIISTIPQNECLPFTFLELYIIEYSKTEDRKHTYIALKYVYLPAFTIILNTHIIYLY